MCITEIGQVILQSGGFKDEQRNPQTSQKISFFELPNNAENDATVDN